MKLKKMVAFGLAAVMSVSLLGGCGSSKDSGTADKADEAKEATVETKHHKIGVGF